MAPATLRVNKNELKTLIEKAVASALDEKLLEFFGDPDEGLELRPEVRARLLRQQKQVKAGKWGQPMEEVIKELGLD